MRRYNLGLVASAIGNFAELAVLIVDIAKHLSEDVEEMVDHQLDEMQKGGDSEGYPEELGSVDTESPPPMTQKLRQQSLILQRQGLSIRSVCPLETMGMDIAHHVSAL